MVERVITATSPCMKFSKVSLNEQLEKLKEEVTEVQDAILAIKGLKDSEFPDGELAQKRRREMLETLYIELMMEMLDVQTCINTMFEQVHKDRLFDYNMLRKRAEIAVIQKNLARGYYAEEVIR
jgi:hypothetical protein